MKPPGLHRGGCLAGAHRQRPGGQLDVDAVLVFLRDDRDGKLHLRAGTEGLASLLRSHGLALSNQLGRTVGWVATEQAPRLIPDVREDHVFTPLPEAPDMRSALGLPLAQGSDVVGAPLLLARQVGVFTSADLPVYQMIAAHLTVSIANSRQYERTQRTRMVEDVVVALAEQVSPARSTPSASWRSARACSAWRSTLAVRRSASAEKRRHRLLKAPNGSLRARTVDPQRCRQAVWVLQPLKQR